MKIPVYYERNEVPWADKVEQKFNEIRSEICLSSERDSASFNVAYDNAFLEHGDFWTARNIIAWGLTSNREYPKTLQLMRKIGAVNCFISRLAPGSDLKKYNGETDGYIRCHLPLVVPGGLPDVGLDLAEFDYQPTACGRSYRMIVIRQHIDEMKGQKLLLNKERYLCDITNDRTSTPEQIVITCNDRCEQENLIEQLKNGPRSLTAPVDNLYSNWAYMLMTSLAWSLKAWLALSVPETGRWKIGRREEKFRLLKMEFQTFVTAMIRIPCQIVRTSRRTIYRLLNGNKMQPVFWRLVASLQL